MRWSRLLVGLGIGMLAACSGGGDGGTTPSNQGFSVTVTGTSLTLEQGASGSLSATISRTGNYAGTVNLSAENLPSGITASFAPAAITPSTNATTLNVSVASSVAPGSYSFTIRGQASGVTQQYTATIGVTVTAKPAIAVVLTPPTGNAPIGGGTTYTATVQRTNFTGGVSVAVTGAPTGVTTSVSSNGDSHTISVNVASSVAAGTYQLTTTASGTGVTSASAQFALVVAAPQGSVALSISTGPMNVSVGGRATVRLEVARTNFTGVATLALSGVPAGVTATPVTTATNGDAFPIVIDAGPSAAAGSTPITFTVSGPGIANTVLQANLIVAAPTGSVTASLSPSAITVAAGAADVQTTITIARTNFAGTVFFQASQLPTGLTLINTISTTGNTGTFIFTVGSGVAPGTYPVVITTWGVGIATVNTQLALTVTAPQPSSIALAFSRNPVAAVAGTTEATSLVFTRTNFTGAISATATAPAGITPTINGSPTLTNGMTMNIAVGAGVAPGAYTVTVTATGTGITAVQGTVTVNVTAPPAGGNVTFGFCGPTADVPIWVAVKDGAGAWTRVTATSGNNYSFNIASNGGVAWVTQNAANDYDLTIAYGSAAELNARGSGVCTTPNPKSVTGSASGFGTLNSDVVLISFGGASPTTAPTFASPNFTINNVPDGARDIVAVRSAIDLANPLLGLQANKLFVSRALNPANGGSIGTINFNSLTDAFDPDTKQITVNGGVGGRQLTAGASFVTGNGSGTVLGSVTTTSTNVVNYKALPSARTIPGDLHIVSATENTLSGFSAVASRSITSMFRDATNTTLTLGAELNAPTVSSTNSGYARLRALLARQGDYQNLWLASFDQRQAGTNRIVIITATSTFLGAGANADIEVPDFSAVSGWQNIWGPVAGVATNWIVQASGWITGAGNQAEGTQSRTATRFGAITP